MNTEKIQGKNQQEKKTSQANKLKESNLNGELKRKLKKVSNIFTYTGSWFIDSRPSLRLLVCLTRRFVSISLVLKHNFEIFQIKIR